MLGLGAVALFSGIALLANILIGFSLPLGLLSAALVLGGILFLTLARADAIDRRHAFGVARAGIVSGLVATVVYDGVRTVLSQLDPSPFDPFGALRVFGTLLLGSSASSGAVMAAGATLHFINGTCFGLAYAALFGRDGQRSLSSALVTGTSWGLFLELFQATLYPDWLRVAALQEFYLISFLGHVAFGLTLGYLSRRFLDRWAYDPYRL
ncbi:MAG TPA: DUF6789 family protein [Acidimicrobiia bacterium]|jgi:hypothetical protein